MTREERKMHRRMDIGFCLKLCTCSWHIRKKSDFMWKVDFFRMLKSVFLRGSVVTVVW